MAQEKEILLSVRGLVKSFGAVRAVDNLNLDIYKGECFGLLGPNGAGKTTSIGLICSLILPSAGEIYFEGRKIQRSDSRRRDMSLITQDYSLRKEFTVNEIMELQGRLYAIPRRLRRERAEALLNFGGLYEHRFKKVKALSGGMKRKLMLCRALLSEPKLMLLDEPTVGMDPESRRQTWDMISRMCEKDLSVLLTTHYIEEAQRLCSRTALMKDGKIDVCAPPDELIAGIGRFTVEEKDGHSSHCSYFESREEAVRYASGLSCSYSLRDTGLEDVYFSYTEKRLLP